jgi:hypothetical protein
MSGLPELGECITLADYDSDPWLLVTEVREESLRAVLCAELPPRHQRRLRETAGDPAGRRELVHALRQTDLQVLAIPRQAIERGDREEWSCAPH